MSLPKSTLPVPTVEQLEKFKIVYVTVALLVIDEDAECCVADWDNRKKLKLVVPRSTNYKDAKLIAKTMYPDSMMIDYYDRTNDSYDDDF